MKCFFRKALRWLAILLATLVVLFLFFYAEEDWRGARDWAACQRELAAKGETLDLRQLVPSGKPEDDLSKAPIFAPLYGKESDAKAPINQLDYRLHAPLTTSEPHLSGYQKGNPLDLEQWRKFYRALPEAGLASTSTTPAEDILQVLSRFDLPMEQIEAALSNPNAFFPIDYEHPSPRPYLKRMFQVVALWQLRGIAHLDNNETELAAKDYLATFKPGPFLLRDGGLVGYVLWFGMRSMDEAILWEGIHRHAWNERQLQKMESALARNDMLAMGQQTLRVSRAKDLRDISTAKKEEEFLKSILIFDDAFDDRMLSFFWMRPDGWNQQDKTAYVLSQQRLIEAIDPREGTIQLEAFASQPENSTQNKIRAFYLPATVALESTRQMTGRTFAKAETYRRLARLACRLEEYRIAHNQYPEKLDELPDLPAHLNQEVLSEQPLHYQRKGEGYALYSVGWNQKDDGGVYSNDAQMGDWPWPSP